MNAENLVPMHCPRLHPIDTPRVADLRPLQVDTCIGKDCGTRYTGVRSADHLGVVARLSRELNLPQAPPSPVTFPSCARLEDDNPQHPVRARAHAATETLHDP